MTEKQTHYQKNGRDVKYEYFTMNAEPDGSVFVYGWGEYERSSVLAGQARKMGLDHFDTEAEAIAVYGDMNFSSKWTEPGISLNHLPGENDFVAGGAYPDDWDGGW
jgi:hypothetical protein